MRASIKLLRHAFRVPWGCWDEQQWSELAAPPVGRHVGNVGMKRVLVLLLLALPAGASRVPKQGCHNKTPTFWCGVLLRA